MLTETPLFRADVKCYHCGHISGQIIGYRHQPLGVENFIPRPGYSGEPMQPGRRLRCERCRGPVFLEEVGAEDITEAAQARPPRSVEREAA